MTIEELEKIGNIGISNTGFTKEQIANIVILLGLHFSVCFALGKLFIKKNLYDEQEAPLSFDSYEEFIEFYNNFFNITIEPQFER